MKVMNIGGVELKVTAVACDHCGKEPSEPEVVHAIQNAQASRSRGGQSRCAFCGDGIKASAYELYHDRDGWHALEKDVEPAISLEVLPQVGGRIKAFNGLHQRCIPKALPYGNGLEYLKPHESTKR